MANMTGTDLTILLAEDNPGDVFLIRRALTEAQLSFELLCAKDGEAAIAYVTEAASGQRRIDLLLLDLNLPRRGGIEVLSHLRTFPALAAVPAIMLTSSDSPQDRDSCLELGANRYFRKPSDLDQYMEIGTLARQLTGFSAG